MLSWDAMKKSHGNIVYKSTNHQCSVPDFGETQQLRTSVMVGGKTDAAEGGTLGSFGCAGSTMGGGHFWIKSLLYGG